MGTRAGFGVSVALMALAAACTAQDEQQGSGNIDEAGGERTSGYSDERNAYFGDLHIHTKNSFDAYIFNVRTTPEDAYRFARGETVKHPSGYDISISGPPLDFLGVTDHGAYMGILPAMDGVDERLSKLPIAKQLYGTDPAIILQAFQLIGGTVRSGKAIEEIYDKEIIGQTWKNTIAAAEKYNEPGVFTTFTAYEYTSTYAPGEGSGSFAGGNLHRNVVFKGSAPDRPFSTLDSTNPEDLWDWMDEQRDAGHESLAIPHNSNVSNSEMFKLKTYAGQPLTKAYAEQRMRNEPLVEITQVKGTSETHPALSPNDEWANFEIYDKLLASNIVSDNRYSYVRQSVRDGLVMQDQQGFNPFRFGFIGSSDSHVAGGSYAENNFWSKVGVIDGTAVARGSVPPDGKKTWDGVIVADNAKNWFSRWAASGLAGVWAEENTRESIFAAMRRKETFATSGPRIKLRFFGSFDFQPSILDDPMLVKKAYASGVPMGGDMLADGDAAPAFIAWAMRDPDAAPLQRLQVIKLWSDGSNSYEKVIDIACSDGLSPDAAAGRCPDNGAAVNLKDCSITPNKGAGELRVVWRDPDYKAGQRAAYYLRALENPTCRWSTWDALKAGAQPNPALQPILQERAWSSPIWLAPAG